MYTVVQRAGDRNSGGVMIGLENMWNGPVSCPPKTFVSRLDRLPPLSG
ncbi:hypothetical protein SATMO3_30390 [Sporomusa aerivorans]